MTEARRPELQKFQDDIEKVQARIRAAREQGDSLIASGLSRDLCAALLRAEDAKRNLLNKPR